MPNTTTTIPIVGDIVCGWTGQGAFYVRTHGHVPAQVISSAETLRVVQQIITGMPEGVRALAGDQLDGFVAQGTIAALEEKAAILEARLKDEKAENARLEATIRSDHADATAAILALNNQLAERAAEVEKVRAEYIKPEEVRPISEADAW